MFKNYAKLNLRFKTEGFFFSTLSASSKPDRSQRDQDLTAFAELVSV